MPSMVRLFISALADIVISNPDPDLNSHPVSSLIDLEHTLDVRTSNHQISVMSTYHASSRGFLPFLTISGSLRKIFKFNCLCTRLVPTLERGVFVACMFFIRPSRSL